MSKPYLALLVERDGENPGCDRALRPEQTTARRASDCRAQSRESSGGDERTRTADPLLAKQVLYQLSYVPAPSILATGLSRVEDSRRRPA